MIHLRIAGAALALGALLVTGCSGGESDPVADCEKAAGPVWERVLGAQTTADIEAAGGIWTLPGCRELTADQKAEFRRENSETGDKIAAHILRVALTEEGEQK